MSDPYTPKEQAREYHRLPARNGKRFALKWTGGFAKRRV